MMGGVTSILEIAYTKVQVEPPLLKRFGFSLLQVDPTVAQPCQNKNPIRIKAPGLQPAPQCSTAASSDM